MATNQPDARRGDGTITGGASKPAPGSQTPQMPRRTWISFVVALLANFLLMQLAVTRTALLSRKPRDPETRFRRMPA